MLNYESLEDVIDMNKKKLCFKPNIQYPCIYDLRVLAHSRGWRSKENIFLLSDSVNRLFTFPQFGDDVYSYRKGQYYSPCGAFINSPILGGDSARNGQIGSDWLDRMELFARCGIIKRVEALKNEYEALIDLLALNGEDLPLKIELRKHKNEFGWSPYSGIALEEHWKSKTRKQCDILFRILLILHYTECA